MIPNQRVCEDETQQSPQWNGKRSRKACQITADSTDSYPTTLIHKPSHHLSQTDSILRADANYDTPRKTKRLRFSETSKLAIVPPRSDRDISNAWYNKKDTMRFKSDVKKCTLALRETRTAKAMKQIAYSAATGRSNEIKENMTFRGQEHFRGLEHMLSREVMKLLLERRNKNVQRVVEEQEMQRSLGVNDPSRIAKLSMSNSEFTKEWSCLIANLREC